MEVTSRHLEPTIIGSPRQALSSKLINHIPAILFFGVTFTIPVYGLYFLPSECARYVGRMGFAPIPVMMTILGILVLVSAARRRDLDRIDNTFQVAVFRAIMVVSATVWIADLIIIWFWCGAVLWARAQDKWSNDPVTRIQAILAVPIGFIFMPVVVYLVGFQFWWCAFQEGITRSNAVKHGNPLYVSLPMFKLCGHYVLYTLTHKYELRLRSGPLSPPTFENRELAPKEFERLKYRPWHYLELCGWTALTHHQIVQIFKGIEQETHARAKYNPLKNNCRTFLRTGFYWIANKIVKVQHSSPWIMDNPSPEESRLEWMWVILMFVPIGRSAMHEFCQWMYSVIFGQDWERPMHNEKTFFDLADDTQMPLANAWVRYEQGQITKSQLFESAAFGDSFYDK